LTPHRIISTEITPMLPYALQIGDGDESGTRVGPVVLWLSFLNGGPVRPVREPDDPDRDEDDDDGDDDDKDEEDDDDDEDDPPDEDEEGDDD